MIYSNMRIGWNDHKLTKIPLIECDQIRFIFQLAVQKLLPSVLQYLHPIGFINHQQQIWCQHMNFQPTLIKYCKKKCLVISSSKPKKSQEKISAPYLAPNMVIMASVNLWRLFFFFFIQISTNTCLGLYERLAIAHAAGLLSSQSNML